MGSDQVIDDFHRYDPRVITLPNGHTLPPKCALIGYMCRFARRFWQSKLMLAKSFRHSL
jgi:hypothetical protein